MNDVIYLPTYFKPLGREITVKVPTGEKKPGFFGGEKDVTRKETRWEQTGWSDCEIDGDRLSEDIAKEVKAANERGFEVISITPITSGRYNYYAQGISSQKRLLSETEAVSGGVSYGYGYSITEGVVIVLRRADMP